MLPIFEAFPSLASPLPTVKITQPPSEVRRLQAAGEHFDHPGLYIKRDDRIGPLFGGNKVRTLDFLLAAAFKEGGNLVSGLPGTSMALAANVYARRAGLPLTTLLYAQTRTREAQIQLRYFHYLDADLIAADSMEAGARVIERLEADAQDRYGHGLFHLEASSPLGMCGYVNAAFELKQQVHAGELPEPDRLYLPMALLGTSVGLWLGLKAAGMKTGVVSAYNQPLDGPGRHQKKTEMIHLFNQCLNFLRERDPVFPFVTLEESEIELRCADPAAPRQQVENGLGWIPRFAELEGIPLEATWSAQAFAVMASDLAEGRSQDQNLLFWHTPNSRPFPDEIDAIDYHRLPPAFHAYFEADELADVNQPAWF